jgi:hypothetical protein
MLQNMVDNQWFWLGAAGLLIVVLGLLVTAHRIRGPSTEAAAQDQQGEGWSPTGRIDFASQGDPNDSTAGFLLQAEDARIVNSVGGLEHHQTRWRRATLKEAKKVVKAYHEKLDLPMTARSLASSLSSNNAQAELQNGAHDLPAARIDAPDGMVEDQIDR